MIVRFAAICDDCHRRSPEYQPWPICRVCGEDLCPDCYTPGTFEPADEGVAASCLCFECDEMVT